MVGKINFKQQTDFSICEESVLFKLYSLIVVEMYVFTYEEASLLIVLKFCSVNTLGFEH